MPEPLLLTKLHIPPPRLKIVPRPHLIERLNEDLQSKLTLISTPSCIGTTRLGSEWIVGCGKSIGFAVRDKAYTQRYQRYTKNNG